MFNAREYIAHHVPQGWPTGLGALLVKRSSADYLRAGSYFGGGTIDSLSFERTGAGGAKRRQDVVARLQHGTPPYLDVVALSHAIDAHERLFGTLARVARHTATLADEMRQRLVALRHANGRRVIKLHEAFINTPNGPTIALSVLDARGQFVGHAHVERLATINGIQLRAGGLCNTGAWTAAFGLDDDDLKRLAASGRACWDEGARTHTSLLT